MLMLMLNVNVNVMCVSSNLCFIYIYNYNHVMHTYTDTHNNSYKQTPVFSPNVVFTGFTQENKWKGYWQYFFSVTLLTQNPKLCKESEYAISFSLVRRSKFQVLL